MNNIARDSLQDAAVLPISPAPRTIDYFSLQSDGVEQQVSSRASSDSDTSLQQLTGDIEETVDCLIKLTPTLQDPAPQDMYKRHASHSEANMDIDLATKMFPKATRLLTNRLGFANWKRRQYLQSLKPQGHDRVPSKQKVKENERRESNLGFYSRSNVTRPGYRTGAFSSHVTATSPATSDAGPPSINDTIFSRSNYFSERSVPTTVESDQLVMWNRYDVPKPPVMLGSGSTFDCPYCGQEIIFGIQIASHDDWTDHVIMDLEPYLCTFDDCLRADKTFSSREDWFQHELDNHRLRKVWFCRSCAHEFDEREDIELHLSEKHKSTVSSGHLSTLVSLCERYSENTAPNQSCPLCGCSTAAPGELKQHIGDHLEQLALSAIQSNDGLEKDFMSPCFDDTASKNRAKFVNEFVEEQRGYFWQPTQQPHDDGTADSNVAFAEDSDDEGFGQNVKRFEVKAEPASRSRSRRPPMQRRGDSWMTKVKTFLEKQSTDQTDGDLWMTKVETFLENQSMQGDPPMESEVNSPGPNVTSQIPNLVRPLHPFRTKPPPRNEDFIGRDGDLARLHKTLSTPGKTCVLSGAGGMGKTGAAIEYTYRYEETYSFIFWISAETSISCADTYSLIATQLIVTEDDTAHDQDRLITLGREFLEQTEKRWLLVFDNANAWSDIQEFLPTDLLKSNGSILITTRKSDLRSSAPFFKCHVIELGALTLEESRRLLLLSMQPSLDRKELALHPEYKLAGEIAVLAERLPLALAHIAGYVQVSKCTLTDFVQLWNERRRHTRGPSQMANPLTLSTDRALETVWNIGLREVTIDARELLNILAFLDSETIQRKLLVGEHEEPSLDFLHSDQAFRQAPVSSLQDHPER